MSFFYTPSSCEQLSIHCILSNGAFSAVLKNWKEVTSSGLYKPSSNSSATPLATADDGCNLWLLTLLEFSTIYAQPHVSVLEIVQGDDLLPLLVLAPLLVVRRLVGRYSTAQAKPEPRLDSIMR